MRPLACTEGCTRLDLKTINGAPHPKANYIFISIIAYNYKRLK